MDKIAEYLHNIYLLDEISLLNEDLSSFIKRITHNKANDILSRVKSAVFKRDPKVLKKVISRIPVISVDTLKKLGKKNSPDFDKSFRISYDFLKRTSDLPEGEPIDYMACIVAIISTSREGDIVENTKESLRKFDSFVKKNKSKFVKEQAGASLGGGFALVIGGIVTIVGLFSATFSTVLIGLILVALGSFVAKMMG